MRGEVEIWRNDELLLKEPNMLVDGAGELLADIMTVSPSLSSIEDTGASSILDASNYRVQAISFGTGADAFRSNAHVKDADIDTWFQAFLTDLTNGAWGNYAVTKSFLRLPTKSSENTNHPAYLGFPVPPTPVLEVLEENTSVPTIVEGAEDELTVSSYFPGNGQLTNFIPSAIISGSLEGIVDSFASGIRMAAALGAFPDGSSSPHSTQGQVAYVSGIYPTTLTTATFITHKGSFFNEVSSMDCSGFVNMVMSSVPHAGLDFSGGASGLCLSAEAPDNDYQGWPFVEYTVSLSDGDLLFAHAYGGITHLGLWSIDMKQSLLNGNTPPFAFSVLNNPRKYKLFCRKGLSFDITSIDDLTAYEDLTIKWRIHFR